MNFKTHSYKGLCAKGRDRDLGVAPSNKPAIKLVKLFGVHSVRTLEPTWDL